MEITLEGNFKVAVEFQDLGAKFIDIDKIHYNSDTETVSLYRKFAMSDNYYLITTLSEINIHKFFYFLEYQFYPTNVK
ncbi:MAG TPA: hypothetical protein PKV92_09045 [Thermodesulfovibrio thiophilus]|nr:hypothetical protein [Thermodesulfovibrio thiophilus]HQD37224.1 hypothetical protein [Thermodesulfovibrio thiophilus]